MAIGNERHTIAVTDEVIVKAASPENWKCRHRDAPTELELDNLRADVMYRMGVTHDKQVEMLSLHWLRNRFVQLRKSPKNDL